jgi:hypothetical protein
VLKVVEIDFFVNLVKTTIFFIITTRFTYFFYESTGSEHSKYVRHVCISPPPHAHVGVGKNSGIITGGQTTVNGLFWNWLFQNGLGTNRRLEIRYSTLVSSNLALTYFFKLGYDLAIYLLLFYGFKVPAWTWFIGLSTDCHIIRSP